MKKLLLLTAVIAVSLSSFAQTGWIQVNSNLSTGNGVGYLSISILDNTAIWGAAIGGDGLYVDEFTKSTDGGETWTSGTFGAGDPSMIFGINDMVAYAPINSGSNPGIYKTTDGGANWTYQSTAFSSSSFPNVVHFFNENDGVAQGDPLGGYFEIYTTTDGGENWSRVPQANIPDPVSGEYGITGNYSAVGDNIWFGTNKGRVYRSTDKGYTWDVSSTTWGTSKAVDVTFKDALHGLAFQSYLDIGIVDELNETSDGGATWTSITPSGDCYGRFISYVPGTDNTYVGTASDETAGMGCSYSYDGGHNWITITDGYPFHASAWIDNETGWAGTWALSGKSTGGMYIYDGDPLTPPGPSVLFSDDFESGTSQWDLTGDWGLTEEHYNSATHSLTDSPGGNYSPNVTSYATMATGVDLTDASIKSASVSFYAIYDIETGFDYCYVEVSDDDFATYSTIATFNGEGNLDPWVQYTYSLSNYIGSSNVKVRFHFYSDQGYQVDGIYVDDFQIASSPEDTDPPSIVYTPPEYYEGSLGDFQVATELVDISGISSSELTYIVDGGDSQTVPGINNPGTDEYTFIIPEQTPGSFIDYFITAVDNSGNLLTSVSDTFNIIAGNYLKYDNSQVDFYMEFTEGQGAAVNISLGDNPTQLVTSLIRTYCDQSVGLSDSMLVHVWGPGANGPGDDLITPFMVFPVATFENTSAITPIDLRPYADQLSGLTGEIFIGFTVPAGTVRLTITEPGSGERSFYYDGSNWGPATGSSGDIDFHFRAITSTTDQPFGNPPNNLQATVDGNDVNLTWEEPGTQPTWIHFDDGTNNDGIGLTGGGTYDVAIRFVPYQLLDYNGMYLTKVKFFPRGENTTYKLRVWTGEDATNLIVDQALSGLVFNEWNTITLDEPVLIDAYQELWIGYNLVQPVDDFSAGCDAGPAVDGYGNMINLGGWASLYSLNPDLDYNWNIQGYVTHNPGGKSISIEPIINENTNLSKGMPQRGFLKKSPKASTIDRAFLGYNVYRDETKINESIVTDLSYDDLSVPSGTHQYEVTSVYDQGESEPAGPISVDIGTPVISVTPTSMSEALEPDSTSTQTLTISNSGVVNLNFNINIEYGSEKYVKNHSSSNIHKIKKPTKAKKSNNYAEKSINPINNNHYYATSGRETLWDNTDIGSGTSGIVSTELTGLPVDHTLVNTADDFIVPDSLVWTINFVYTEGFSNLTNVADAFGVVFYNDNDGAPGDIIYSETNVPEDINNETQSLTLAEPLTLSGGHYWLSVYGIYYGASSLDDGRWNWTTGTTGIESDAMLQDLTGIFGGFNWTSLPDLGVDNPSCFFIIEGTQTAAMNWLSVNPAVDTIASNESEDLEVTFDAAGLETGDYTANILISSNDPVTPVDTVPVLLGVSVGLNEFDNVATLIYPNPANDFINIKSTDEINKVKIFNYVGQKVYENNVNTKYFIINTSSYKAGIYIIKLQTNKALITRKITVK